MKAKQIAFSAAFAALTVAGAASAQTVPAEEWVGPPIARSGSFARSDVTADMRQAMAQPQAPQQVWVGPMAAAGIQAGDASRAEVKADFRLFARAGLSNYATSEQFDPYGNDFKRRAALYQRMRSGPEFAQEVERIEGARRPAVATATGPESGSD